MQPLGNTCGYLRILTDTCGYLRDPWDPYLRILVDTWGSPGSLADTCEIDEKRNLSKIIPKKYNLKFKIKKNKKFKKKFKKRPRKIDINTPKYY